MVGMVLVGILAIAAKTWLGWKRFVPLLAVVLAPLSLAIGNMAGSLQLGIIPFYGMWVLLGVLVATSEPVRKQQVLAAA
jgi:hypothetical protein